MFNKDFRLVIEIYGRDLKIFIYEEIVKEEESYVNKLN